MADEMSVYGRWLEAQRTRLRGRIAAELSWVKSAVESIERSAESGYAHADGDARGTVQHLVEIAAAAAELRALDEASKAMAAT